ncbi:MAG: dprA [Burkholderiaceae bacterium]|nr:dprA [Burkholderiaceae bacterium]
MNTDTLSATEIELWLKLMSTEGVGDVTAQLLLKSFGLPEQIFAQSHTSLTRVVSDRVARALLGTADDEFKQLLERTRAWGEQAGNHIISLSCPTYPQHLLSTADPPVLLYVKGRIDLLNAPRTLAMVGSRNATAQGIKNTEWFAEELAQGGCQIVSGLALGIDAAAHRGALNAYHKSPNVAGSTIAVIGTGCDIIYPARNRELTYAIAEQGVIISEFPLGAKAQPSHFPRRNRIISGLSQGVLVVEAALQSGSLITARQALEQNREVFAIPGSIHSPLSKGCHALIKQGAKLVECAQDILDELQPTYPLYATDTHKLSESDTQSTGALALSNSAQHILDALGHDPCDVDTLASRVQMDVGKLLAELMELELSGMVEKRAGQIYVRLYQ